MKKPLIHLCSILSFTIFFIGSNSVFAATPKLCSAKKSKVVLIIENNTLVHMHAVRNYLKNPALPAINENSVTQPLGFSSAVSVMEAKVEMKVGNNSLVFTPICNGAPMTNASGKIVRKKIKYIEKRGRTPNCTKRIRFTLFDSSFDVRPFSCGVSYGNFNGSWNCPGRGTITINQNGPAINGGSFGGIIGQDWAAPNNGIIAAGGTVNGQTMTAKLLHNTSNYSIVNAILTNNGQNFSGDWSWYSPSGVVLASGTWSCAR